MTRPRHQIPTGLAVEDRFISYGAFSLSFRQLLVLVSGSAAGYGLWKGQDGLPLALRAGLAALPPLAAALVALVQPAGRPVEQWLFVLARYRRARVPALWRPRAVHPDAAHRGDGDLVAMVPARRWERKAVSSGPTTAPVQEEER